MRIGDALMNRDSVHDAGSEGLVRPIWPERHILSLSFALAALVGAGFAGWAHQIRTVAVEPPPPGTIDVVSATFGENCGVPHDNAVQWVRSACVGLKRCNFEFNWFLIGFPAPLCAKDFRIEWKCSARGPTQRTVIPPDARDMGPPQGLLIPLICQ